MTTRLTDIQFSKALEAEIEVADRREYTDDHLSTEERLALVAKCRAERPDAEWTGDDLEDFLTLVC